MPNKPKFETWKKSLDIANIPYEHKDFYDNIDKITAHIVTKYSKNFYIERYSCIFPEDVVDLIYRRNVKHIKDNRKSMYDVENVAKKNNIAVEEAEILVNNRKKSTSGSLSAYINRYGEIEGKLRYDEFCRKSAHTLETFIEKYGKELGPIKFEEYLKTKSSSLDMQILRYGEKEGRKKFEATSEKKKYSYSLTGHIEKYGEEEGRKKYDEFCKSRAVTLEKLVLKYGEEEGRRKYQEMNLAKSKSGSLQGFIERYGEEEGKKLFKVSSMKKSPIYCELRKIYDEDTATKLYLRGRSKKYNNAKKIVKDRMQSVYIKSSKGPTSKQSDSFFETLSEYVTVDFTYGSKGKELKIFDEKNMRIFYYDAYNEDKKIIIEYHGVAYHPKIGEYDWISPYGLGYEEARARDELKRRVALDNGYTFIEIWSDEPLYEKIEKIRNHIQKLERIREN
jgi:hypothetical protein